MYCAKCGVKINPNENYCENCGSPIKYNNSFSQLTPKHFENNDNPFKNIKAKKAQIIVISIITILSIGIIGLIVYNVNEAQKHTPEYLFKHYNRWYRSYNADRLEFLSFASGTVMYTPNAGKQLSDTIGKYSLEGTTLIYKPESGSVHYMKYKEAKDENIQRGLYSFKNDEWYISEKYFYFDGKLYTTDDNLYDLNYKIP